MKKHKIERPTPTNTYPLVKEPPVVYEKVLEEVKEQNKTGVVAPLLETTVLATETCTIKAVRQEIDSFATEGARFQLFRTTFSVDDRNWRTNPVFGGPDVCEVPRVDQWTQETTMQKAVDQSTVDDVQVTIDSFENDYGEVIQQGAWVYSVDSYLHGSVLVESIQLEHHPATEWEDYKERYSAGIPYSDIWVWVGVNEHDGAVCRDTDEEQSCFELADLENTEIDDDTFTFPNNISLSLDGLAGRCFCGRRPEEQ